MKKIVTCLLVAMLAMPLFATVLLTESFDRAIGNLDSGNNTQMGSDIDNWWLPLGTSHIQVIDDNLTYISYCKDAVGKAIQFSGSNGKAIRALKSSVTSGSVYYSCLINVKTLKNSTLKDYLLALLDNGSTTAKYCFAELRTKNDYANNTYQLGITKAAEAFPRFSKPLQLNTTYLVVVRYDFVDGTKNDRAYLWINPTKDSESAPTIECAQDTTNANGDQKGANTVDDATKLTMCYLKPGSDTPSSIVLDEIKVATAWEDLFTNEEEEEEEEEDKDPELTVSKSTLEFKNFTAGETPSLTFTVTGANLTEDITISSESSAFSFSPANISKEDAGTPTTVTVTLSATQATDFSNQTITIASGELNKTVTVKGNVYIPELVEIPAFSFLLNQQDTEGKIYNYTGTSAKILSVDEEYKQIVLKDTKSVKVQISDADWAANTYVEGMKVTKFVFTAEILLGGTQAICTPITLTFAAPNFTREITNTDLATICLKGDVSNFAKLQEKATFYKILYKQEYEGEVYNIVLEEVNTNMEAGKPYIFQPKEPCTMEFYYSATTDIADSENGLIGTFTKVESAEDNILVGKYLISNNMFCKAGAYCSLAANRAYIDMSQVPTEENATPKVGMRHISLQNADARQQPTNLDQFKAQGLVRKAIVNGKFVILNNGKAFNAIGTEIK